MAITEPGCGSDPSRVPTTAVLDAATDEWVLNGEKIFVTTGCRAEGVVVWATVDKSAGRAGIKSFLVEKGAPGFIVAHKEKKLGIRADDTAAYVFKDCRIPRGNLLGGDEGDPEGELGRLPRRDEDLQHDAPGGRGDRPRHRRGGARLHARAARGGRHRDRVRRRRSPAQSAVAQRFLELEALYEAAMLTVLRAAWLSDQGQPNNLEASICKAKAGAAVREITQGCIELLGPMGVSREHLLEKWFRDVRITDIYEGTGQIQRLIIARTILGYGREELKYGRRRAESRAASATRAGAEVLHLHALARGELAARLDPRLDHVGGVLRVVDVFLAAPEAVARVVELRPGRELEGRAVRIGRDAAAGSGTGTRRSPARDRRRPSRSGRSSSGTAPSRRRSSR